MKPSQQLQKALGIVNKPAKWTKFSYAVDKYGKPCLYDAVNARKFCPLGAVSRAAGADDWPSAAKEFLSDAVLAYTGWPYSNVPSFNDFRQTKYEDVVIVFKMAIANAKRVGE